MEIIPKAKRSKFLVTEESDEDLGEDGLDESEEEDDDLFHSVCAICDNGGEVFPHEWMPTILLSLHACSVQNLFTLYELKSF